jgi:hypothetical protein
LLHRLFAFRLIQLLLGHQLRQSTLLCLLIACGASL